MDRVKGLNQETKQGSIIFLFSFLFYALVMYCAPLSSDDLEYYLSPRTEWREALDFALNYGNGRLLGNLGALFLCTNTLLRVCVKAFIIASVIALAAAVTGKYSPTSHLVSFILFTGMSGTLFGQVFTWTSGFQNYVPSIWLSLMIVYSINCFSQQSNTYCRILHMIFVFAAGMASQLFVEISTVINCIGVACLLIVACRSKKMSSHLYVIWFLATVLGACIMFAIPRIFASDGIWNIGYRSMATDSISTLITTTIVHASQLSNYYIKNTLLCILLCGCAWHALRNYKDGMKPVHARICSCALVFSFLYLVINLFLCNHSWYGRLNTVRNLAATICIVIPGVLWLIGILRQNDRCFRYRQLFLISLAVAAILPLLIVNPISMRCIFHSYVLLAIAVIDYLSTQVMIPPAYGLHIRKWIRSCALILALCVSMMFCNIQWLSNVRNQYIHSKMERGETEITIFQIPYDYVLWDSVNIYQWKYYYTEPGDIEFTAIYYEDWSWMYGEEIIAEGD